MGSRLSPALFRTRAVSTHFLIPRSGPNSLALLWVVAGGSGEQMTYHSAGVVVRAAKAQIATEPEDQQSQQPGYPRAHVPCARGAGKTMACLFPVALYIFVLWYTLLYIAFYRCHIAVYGYVFL